MAKDGKKKKMREAGEAAGVGEHEVEGDETRVPKKRKEAADGDGGQEGSKRPKPKDFAALASGGERKEEPRTKGGGILSEETFEQQDICEETKKGIADQNFVHLSLIQAKTLKPLLAGRDLLAQAKTGSGKTLAFLMPSIELLHKSHFAQRNGTGAVILAPTRELALQTYAVARETMKYHKHTHGVVMGGGEMQ